MVHFLNLTSTYLSWFSWVETVWFKHTVDFLESTSEIMSQTLPMKKTRFVADKRKAAQMRQDELISTVTHELRTPLTSIRAMSDILHDNPDLDVQQRQRFLEIILQESERLTEVVEDVIDLTELELGGVEEGMVELDLKQAAQEAIRVVSGLLREKQIHFQLRCPDKALLLTTDRRRVLQVMITLLTNAINFCRPVSGWVGVRLAHRGDTLLVTVSDNGQPVGQNGRPTLPVGTGLPTDTPPPDFLPMKLDLLISQEVIDCLGGQLWAEPDLSYGAKFCFYLPLMPPHHNAC